jgi:prepilin-type N-terminal cleavage/methylation domain-containing protein
MKLFSKQINKKVNPQNQYGFTIVELIVSLAIFAIMTSLILSKYGKFDQGVILTNLAYDVALTIRNAQSYGLNVRSASRDANAFDTTTSGGSYGVHFDKSLPSQFIFFVDGNGNGIYDDLTNSDQKTTIKRGSSISSMCVSDVKDCINGVTVFNNLDELDITFKRPDPNAIITANGVPTKKYGYAEIVLKAVDNTTRKVIVNFTGQISVDNNR